MVSNAERKGEVTALLTAWGNGDEQALATLMPIVYNELRRMARRLFRREHKGHTLQTTALINEVYLRLVDTDLQWHNRAHFFGVAAQSMRRVLVDHARRRNAAKRGGAEVKVSVSEAGALPQQPELDVVALNEALDQLALIDPRHSRIVELRYFGGLTLEETAEVLRVSPATVKNDWKVAKAWLYRELSKE